MSAVDHTMSARHCLRWAKIHPALPGGLHQPKRDGDIGWDLEAMESVRLGAHEGQDIAVNARIHLPDGVYADIRNRSSMARRGLYVDQNLIDTGYRGPLFVFIRNMDNSWVDIEAGDRIAQLVFHRATPIWSMEASEITLNTERSEDGFGSTGR